VREHRFSLQLTAMPRWFESAFDHRFDRCTNSAPTGTSIAEDRDHGVPRRITGLLTEINRRGGGVCSGAPSESLPGRTAQLPGIAGLETMRWDARCWFSS
jgi:hypothetical protein